jgi:hypothetical protein
MKDKEECADQCHGHLLAISSSEDTFSLNSSHRLIFHTGTATLDTSNNTYKVWRGRYTEFDCYNFKTDSVGISGADETEVHH